MSSINTIIKKNNITKDWFYKNVLCDSRVKIKTLCEPYSLQKIIENKKLGEAIKKLNESLAFRKSHVENGSATKINFSKEEYKRISGILSNVLVHWETTVFTNQIVITIFKH